MRVVNIYFYLWAVIFCVFIGRAYGQESYIELNNKFLAVSVFDAPYWEYLYADFSNRTYTWGYNLFQLKGIFGINNRQKICILTGISFSSDDKIKQGYIMSVEFINKRENFIEHVGILNRNYNLPLPVFKNPMQWPVSSEAFNLDLVNGSLPLGGRLEWKDNYFNGSMFYSFFPWKKVQEFGVYSIINWYIPLYAFMYNVRKENLVVNNYTFGLGYRATNTSIVYIASYWKNGENFYGSGLFLSYKKHINFFDFYSYMWISDGIFNENNVFKSIFGDPYIIASSFYLGFDVSMNLKLFSCVYLNVKLKNGFYVNNNDYYWKMFRTDQLISFNYNRRWEF